MEKTQLDSICEIYDGVHVTPKYVNQGIPFRSVENLYDKEIEKYVDQDFFIKNYKNKMPSKGDIYISRIGSIGKVKKVESSTPEAYYVTLALLKNIKIDSDYFCYLLQSDLFQKELMRKSLLQAFPMKINMDQLKTCCVKIHTKNLHVKIGSFPLTTLKPIIS